MAISSVQLARAGEDAHGSDDHPALRRQPGPPPLDRRGRLIAPELIAAEWGNEGRVLDAVKVVIEAGATGVMFSESFAGGTVLQCAGPWRTSGEWWNAQFQGGDGAWNRDEWDVSLSDGAVYRIFVDRMTDGWFIDAIVD